MDAVVAKGESTEWTTRLVVYLTDAHYRACRDELFLSTGETPLKNSGVAKDLQPQKLVPGGQA